MKKAMLTIMTLFMINITYAQFNFGPKVGLSSSELDFTGKSGNNGSSILPGESTVGFHAGIFARVNLGALYIQPEALFTQSGGEIRLDGFSEDIREVEFNKLDFPVMVGMKFARIFRLQAGPTLSILLDAELDGLDQSIKSGYEDATIGYQAGVGVDLWNLIFDLKYEGNLSNFGDEIIGFETDQRNNQWIVSVGFKLF